MLCQVNGQMDKALIFISGFSNLYKLQFGSGDEYTKQLHLIVPLLSALVLNTWWKQALEAKISSEALLMTRMEVYVLCDMTQTFDTDMTPKQLPSKWFNLMSFFFFWSKTRFKKINSNGNIKCRLERHAYENKWLKNVLICSSCFVDQERSYIFFTY